jgi:HTH-type transcriptional repressor of NAD biosynthesis genes
MTHPVKRICVVGAESTGKTTLARRLATHYHTICVGEYGRDYTEQNVGPEKLFGYQWKTPEFVHIAEEQLRREDEAAKRANRLLICDTDALATAIWHERYLGTRSPEVEAIAAARNYDLYLVTDCDVPFVQDGLRDGEHLRKWMTSRFISELTAHHRHWTLLSGSWDDRYDKARAEIDKLLASV